MQHIEWYHKKSYKSGYAKAISTFFADRRTDPKLCNMPIPQQIISDVPFPLKYVRIEFEQGRLNPSDIQEFFNNTGFRINLSSESKPIILENGTNHNLRTNVMQFEVGRYIDVGEQINVDMAVDDNNISRNFSVKISLIPGRLETQGTHECICEKFNTNARRLHLRRNLMVDLEDLLEHQDIIERLGFYSDLNGMNGFEAQLLMICVQQQKTIEGIIRTNF